MAIEVIVKPPVWKDLPKGMSAFHRYLAKWDHDPCFRNSGPRLHLLERLACSCHPD